MKINIWKDYLKQRYLIDILMYSYAPLMIVVVLSSKVPSLAHVIIGFAVNYLMYSFAFLYNDMEDRFEDAASPGKRFKNLFGYNIWSLEFGYFLLLFIALVSLLSSFLIGGVLTFSIAFTNLLAGLVYSYKKLRLKHYPFIDFLSHSYLLAGVQMLFFLSLPGASLSIFSIICLFGLMVFSIGGDLENEYRDFEDDQKAGLKNSAHYLGKQKTYFVSRSCFGIGCLLCGISLVASIFNF